MNSEYKHEIETYYDECERDYEIVWQLKDSMALHYGFWDKNTKTHRQALWNMNYELIKNAQIKPTDYVLDAGCGIGGTCFFIAQNIGAKVHGISLSPTQIARANEYREKSEVQDLTQFSLQNFTKTNFENETFDAIIGIESIVHAEKKEDFLREAYRILKPNGRIIISDYFLRKPANENEKIILEKWAKSWAIDDFIYDAEFNIDAKKVGFKKHFAKDISENTFPSIKLMHRSSYPGLIISLVSNFFGYRTKAQIINSKSGRYQFLAYRNNLWKYKHFIAFKSENIPENIEIFSSNDIKVERYIDDEIFKDRFPILKDGKINFKNLIKRAMHYYLENNIKDSKSWW